MNRNSNTQRTDMIDIGTTNHSKLVSLFDKNSKVLSKIIQHCKVEVIDNKLILLVFNNESIYSVQAKKRKKNLIERFSEIVNKPMKLEIKICNFN